MSRRVANDFEVERLCILSGTRCFGRRLRCCSPNIVQLVAPALVPFVIGLALAYFLNPVVDAMGRAGIPRWVSAILLLAAMVCLITLVLVFVLARSSPSRPPASSRRLREKSAGSGIRLRRPRATSGSAIPAGRSRRSDPPWKSFTSSAPSLLGSFVQGLWNQGTAAVNFFTVVLITPVVFFYVVMDWPKMMAKINSWLPRHDADQIRALAIEIDSRISAFIRGQGVVCILLALYYATALSFAGLDYGLLVGILTGLASFIPIFGWSLGALAAMIIAFIQHWPDLTPILIIAGIMLAGQALESGY